MSKVWVNLAKPCSSPSAAAQVFAVDANGGDSEPGETSDSELPPGPSEDEAVERGVTTPLKGQFGTAQMQDSTLSNALKNVQVWWGLG